MPNRVTRLFNISYPIIQAGMVWCSGWRLAAAVSEAGGLGLIGSGSMDSGLLRHHIRSCAAATARPFGVNVPLIYAETERIMEVILEEGVRIVFTSAGNPKTWTPRLKAAGVTVVHVVSSAIFAQKSQDAGVDAVVAEGFEAGGHNGREETTTFCLVPLVRDTVSIPVLAAGGVTDGRTMLAAMALGAEGVQIGSRFAVTEESSAHLLFKQRVVEAREGETILTLKQLNPVRMLKNSFYSRIMEKEKLTRDPQEFIRLLGRARSRKGIFEGDLENGELEIGQASARIHAIIPAGELVRSIWKEYVETKKDLLNE